MISLSPQTLQCWRGAGRRSTALLLENLREVLETALAGMDLAGKILLIISVEGGFRLGYKFY